MKIWLKRFGKLIAALIVLLIVALVIYIYKSFPTLSGEAKLAGLLGEVSIKRDMSDVTHIEAKNTLDVWRAMGYTHASGSAGRDPFTSKVVDSLFVGETENIGNPGTDAEKAYGRSLPKIDVPDFPIRGYEYYDYRHDVVNTTFENYQDNATRKTGAISHLLYTSFGASSNNAIEKLKFINAKPVYYPPMEKKWGNDNNAGSAAYKTAVFRDRDGSLGLGPNSFVVIHDGVNDSMAVDAEACEIKPTWNAAVCKGDVGRLSFGGGGGGPSLSGPPGPPPGPPGPGRPPGGWAGPARTRSRPPRPRPAPLRAA